MKESRAVVQRRARNSGAPVGRPRKLVPEAILQAALEIIDRHGADKLSMRSLAAHLKVQPNAIYTHYDNLEAIEEAVVEKLLTEIPLPDATSQVSLKEQLIEHFVALRAAYMLHPRITTGRVGSPAWIRNARHLDGVLAQLAARKVDTTVAELAYNTLVAVAHTSAAQANAYRAEDPVHNQRDALSALKAIEANYVIEVMNLPRQKLSGDQRFRSMLGSLIDQLLPAAVARVGKGSSARG